MRRIGEGDIRRFSAEVRNDPVLVVRSVELDRITGKMQDRYFEAPIFNLNLSMIAKPDGSFESAHLYNRRTGEGLLEIPQEAQYLAIKKIVDGEQARLAKEGRMR